MSYIETVLESIGDDFNEAEKPARGGVPDGDYEVRLTSRYMKALENGTVFLVWSFETANGRKIEKNTWLGNGKTKPNQIGLGILKSDMEITGVFLDDVQHLSNLHVLSHGIGREFKIKVATKGEYKNIYINERIGEHPNPEASTDLIASGGGQAPPPSAEEEDYDIPF